MKTSHQGSRQAMLEQPNRSWATSYTFLTNSNKQFNMLGSHTSAQQPNQPARQRDIEPASQQISPLSSERINYRPSQPTHLPPGYCHGLPCSHATTQPTNAIIFPGYKTINHCQHGKKVTNKWNGQPKITTTPITIQSAGGTTTSAKFTIRP